MTAEKDETLQALDQDYQYGFKDEIEPIYTTGTGLSEEVVRQISAAKNEPDWMLDFRLKAYQTYLKMPLPAFGPDLTKIDFDHLNYFRRDAKKAVRDWDEVPDKIKETFEKLGVPQAERQYLAGSSAQYESEVVYEKNQRGPGPAGRFVHVNRRRRPSGARFGQKVLRQAGQAG